MGDIVNQVFRHTGTVVNYLMLLGAILQPLQLSHVRRLKGELGVYPTWSGDSGHVTKVTVLLQGQPDPQGSQESGHTLGDIRF